MSTTIYALLTLVSLAVAETIHVVRVGNKGHAFTPHAFKAAVGDRVEFYIAANHTVTQGTYAHPCKPHGTSGFNSGLAKSSNGEPFTITINNTDPIYFYSAASDDCREGMAGAINAPDDASAADYMRRSEKISGVVSVDTRIQGGVFASATLSASVTSTSGAHTSAHSSTTTIAGYKSRRGTARPVRYLPASRTPAQTHAVHTAGSVRYSNATTVTRFNATQAGSSSGVHYTAGAGSPSGINHTAGVTTFQGAASSNAFKAAGSLVVAIALAILTL